MTEDNQKIPETKIVPPKTDDGADMELTDEMREAVRIIRDTNENLYITGKAGAGKTTLLRYIARNISKNMVVTASTGIAAINANGMTLHSLFCIPTHFLGPDATPKFKVKKQRRDLWCILDTVIIDEVSMVRPDIIDFIDRLLRVNRNPNLPFGGVQIVMFGDLYQLPPVIGANEQEVFYRYYDGPYFFYANAFRNTGFHVVELTHVFRQRDDEFVNVLNRIRNYQATKEDYKFLEVTHDVIVSNDLSQGYIHVCAYNRDAQDINRRMLGTPTHSFTANLTGEFSEQQFPGDIILNLRVGARVMLLANDLTRGYCNGSLGEVKAINDDYVTVKLDNGIIADVHRYTWSNNEYVTENNVVKTVERGHCEQFPLMLAWATTIHKTQGLTFDKVVIHAKHTFCPGQMYVALSRCRSLDGIVTDHFIKPWHIIPDYRLNDFEKAYSVNNYYQRENNESNENQTDTNRAD